MEERWAPILADCYLSDEVPVTKSFVCDILDAKSTGKVIQILNSKYPEPRLSHLKRVNSDKKKNLLQVLLTEEKETLEKILQCFSEKEIRVSEPFVVTVPAEGAKTKRQNQFATCLWPVAVFTADKYLESVIEGSNFSEKDKSEINNLMVVALKAAERSKKLGGKGVGAVVAFKGKVLGVGCDLRTRHPLKHACAAVLDMVSWVKQGRQGDPPPWAAPDLAECDFATLRAPESYLCTNYDVVVTREPCTFCAMALLHNRVKRVFYGCAATQGALGSRVKLHTLPGINHRYEVFGRVMREECAQMVADCDVKHDCFS
ncbi:probable inactive tRNA-specific adenosine deaminase-like protein 3 isoform X1 [Cloeon dipterum]|uniref:probable inactive tRNA-specific adenosine deaminase-like protein 3 isoform X1 n=1 Tax=Cloeon dipterum TaxID=197152 RepID=UPI00321FE924